MKMNFRLYSALLIACTVCVAQPFPDRQDLSDLLPREGFTIHNGIEDVGLAGLVVEGIGDIDDDGFDDVALTTYHHWILGEGWVHVLLGTSELRSTFELGDLDGTNGFRTTRAEADFYNSGDIAAAGDVNGDGIDDFLIGAPFEDYDAPGSGTVYLIFGRTTPFPAILDLAQVDGTEGVRFDGIGYGDRAGEAVSGAGDFNGDGLDDILIGAPSADPNGTGSGETYLIFGKTNWPASFDLASLNGTNGFVLRGRDRSDSAGTGVGDAGDVNGDGFDDILIGATVAEPNGFGSGETYLVFGHEAGPAYLELGALDGSDGTTIEGIDSYNWLGHAVDGIGDVNKDGFDDFLVSAFAAVDAEGRDVGQAYLFYGRQEWASKLYPQHLDGSNGVVFNGVSSNDETGESLSAAGDFNGDGLPDLVLGAPGSHTNGTLSGQSHVVFGTDSLPAKFDLETIDGWNGVRFAGAESGDTSGESVSSAGDFNGDGIDDIVIGGPSYHPNFAGVAHVVYGRFETGVTLGATGGSCPGLINLRTRGLTADGEVAVYRGSDRGHSTVQSGPCSGLELDLEDAVGVRIVTANDVGKWGLSTVVEAESRCGTFLQLVDRSTCTVSNVTSIPAD